MAERRMFANAIIDSDAFLDLSPVSQSLYFLLSLQADDEGFVANPKKITRMIGGSENDLQTLETSGFVIRFSSGILCIRHWKVHNSIRGDRFKSTMYRAERAMVTEDIDGVYFLADEKEDGIDDPQPDDNQVTTNAQPDDNQTSDSLAKNDRVVKDRLIKDRLIKVNLINREPAKTTPVAESEFDPPPEKIPKVEKHKYGEFQNVLLTDQELNNLKEKFPDSWKEKIQTLSEGKEMKGYKYKSDYLAIIKWAQRDTPEKQPNNTQVSQPAKRSFAEVIEERNRLRNDQQRNSNGI